jgi:hypothetical protein
MNRVMLHISSSGTRASPPTMNAIDTMIATVFGKRRRTASGRVMSTAQTRLSHIGAGSSYSPATW